MAQVKNTQAQAEAEELAKLILSLPTSERKNIVENLRPSFSLRKDAKLEVTLDDLVSLRFARREGTWIATGTFQLVGDARIDNILAAERDGLRQDCVLVLEDGKLEASFRGKVTKDENKLFSSLAQAEEDEDEDGKDAS